MAEQIDCSEAADANSSYGLRIAALFAILFVSLLGGALPWFSKTTRLDKTFFFITVFAAGVVIATGFVHILPEADEALKNPCLGLSGAYPWAFTFAGAAVLITFMLEYFITSCIRRRHGLSEHGPHGHSHGQTSLPKKGDPTGKDIEAADPEVEAAEKAVIAEASVASIVLEAGVIFHSIFIGIDMGVQPGSKGRDLMIALIFHQACEGLALGSTFMRAKYSTLKYFILMTIYVLITPIGVAIGIGLSSTYKENGRLALGFQGAFNSVSAGILVYNGIVDLLLPTITTADILNGKRLMQLFTMFCLAAGFGVMALLGKWA